MRTTVLLLLLAAAALAGCQTSGSATDDDDRPRGGYFRGQHSAVETRDTLVARTAAEWRDLWARIGEPPPGGLSGDAMAVAVFLGRRDTAGYAVAIEDVRVEGDRAVVLYRERVPGPATPVAQVLSAPYAVALAPRVAGEVSFRPAS